MPRVSRYCEHCPDGFDLHLLKKPLATRWNTTLSSKVNLPHTIDFGALYVADLDTQPSTFRGTEALELHRVESDSDQKSKPRSCQLIDKLTGADMCGPDPSLLLLYYSQA